MVWCGNFRKCMNVMYGTHKVSDCASRKEEGMGAEKEIEKYKEEEKRHFDEFDADVHSMPGCGSY